MHTLETVLQGLRYNRDFMRQVIAWQKFPARPAHYGDRPEQISPVIWATLEAYGIDRLYQHQAEAITAVLQQQNIVIATATASGKSLCYTIPVFDRLLAQPQARALYLFPTKALAHDQLAETRAIIDQGNLPLTVYAYDGDTSQSQRAKARQAQGILLTNPDMLHAGILPQHPRWRSLFSNLHFIILDELHVYRGVFGSHVANVLRRLKRLCEFYGSDPQFICCSATIANPKEHAERLVERPFYLIDENNNGAPTGERHFILYNPPLVDPELGLRRSTILMAKDAAATFLTRQIQTIIFARARQSVELLLTYLQDELAEAGLEPAMISGYRGGYLPLERRAIEDGLRAGQIVGVVSTNALELGIDIGQLTAAVLTGYPGSIAATWQQAGRAGRRGAPSAVFLIAGNSPLDQYICQHPRYLFGNSPEHALCNPNNLRIMVKHLLCASFELPFTDEEMYGQYGAITDLLHLLEQSGLLHATQIRDTTQYHWLGESSPAQSVSLRTSGDDTVVIQDSSGSTPQVIGELDLESVAMLAYEGAIYMHQARTYLVEALDWPGRIAHVRPIMVDYYTRSSLQSTLRQLAAEEEVVEGELAHAYGDVLLVTRATGYRKIKRYSHETLGYGPIDLPEMELATSGYWLLFGEALTERLVKAGILLQPNNYGPNWAQQRLLALERDGHRCRTCGAEAKAGQGLHVHHIRPFREYNYIPGENEAYLAANQLNNLVTLCPACHRRAESGQQTRSALGGLAYVLGNLAPLYLMCDPLDIQVNAETRNPLTQAPTVVIYERVAAGVGFSQRLFQLRHQLMTAALELVQDCSCRAGCPACVGPPADIGPNTKETTAQMLSILRNAVTNRDGQSSVNEKQDE